MLFHIKEILPLDRASDVPIYVQISNKLTHLIASGKVAKGDRLPSSRELAKLLGVHRRTVSLAFDELLAQGFIETKPAKGTFVSEQLPLVQPRAMTPTETDEGRQAGFTYAPAFSLHLPVFEHPKGLAIDEGLPDLRLSPTDEIRRTYNSLLARTTNLRYWSYGSAAGDDSLREQLVDYLRQTRGLSLTVDNVMITRGSQMGLFLALQLLQSDHQQCRVAVGHLNYGTANLTIQYVGAELVTIPIDGEGIDTDRLQQVCEEGGIKAIYVTPHHHHPTTVTLSAERRLHLLELAEKYRFAIIEDDYDYDFHYARTPLLPLASIDASSSVIYIGGFSKILSPALRIGFLVGPEAFVKDAIYLRRIIDRQGDTLMERVLAQMLANGDIQRHCKKALKVYSQRRSIFGSHLQELSDVLSYQEPEGGMAYWVELDKRIPWTTVHQRLAGRLQLPGWKNYDPWNEGHNSIRMGFASLSAEEMAQAFDILRGALY